MYSPSNKQRLSTESVATVLYSKTPESDFVSHLIRYCFMFDGSSLSALANVCAELKALGLVQNYHDNMVQGQSHVPAT